MAKFDSIHSKKLEFINSREILLKRKVSRAEIKLLDIIIEKFIDELEVNNGQIISNGKNIKLTQALNNIFEEFDRIIQSGLIRDYVSDIKKIGSINKKYFGEFESSKKRLGIIALSANIQINRRLGITSKGNTIKGGFLDNFLKDTRLKNEFTELVTKGIISGTSFRELKNDIRIFIVGNEDRLGALNSQYNRFIYDTFQQIDRLEAGIYAKAIGMDSFIYSGGKISTTRKFCCQRNGKIWTVDEAKKWKGLTFQGKSKNYNPLIDLGGYNCRHSTQYISNKIAARRRDDLSLNKEGKLIINNKVNKQKLNKC